MTRRICSECGHTLVQPTADVDGVMGAHMDEHTARHVQRGEASWWVIDVSPDPVSSVRLLVTVIAVGLAVALVITVAIAMGDISQDGILFTRWHR